MTKSQAMQQPDGHSEQAEGWTDREPQTDG